MILLIGIAGMLVSSCTLATTFWGQAAGGRIGIMFAEPLVATVNDWGSALIACTLLILSTAFATQRGVGELIADAFSATIEISVYTFTELPYVVWDWSLWVWDWLCYGVECIFYYSGLSSLVDYFFDEQSVFRRVKDDHYDEDDEYEDDEYEDEYEDYYEDEEEWEDEEEEDRDLSKIVVTRRAFDDRASTREIKKVRSRVKQQMKEFDAEKAFADYEPPDISLLTRGHSNSDNANDDELRDISRIIELKLQDFNIDGQVTQVHPGPVITLFEFEPAPGIKVGKIAALQDDLAMSLKANSIRILAPIPNRGTVGIEVPNRHREIVRLRDVLESEQLINSDSILSVPLGKDTYGEPIIDDIAKLPHLLIAGATGTGKSVCINALLISLLYKASPAELGLILIDPKILELSVYEGIPHLKVPVVTNPRQAKAVLEWAVNEMNRRYRLMQKFGVRNIDGYNRVARGESEEEVTSDAPDGFTTLGEGDVIAEGEEASLEDLAVADPISADDSADADQEALFQEKIIPLPKIVIVIDELADLMLSVGRDIEDLVARLAQKARAAGLHLIVATQRPSVDVVTGLIKANFPARLSFRVSSRIDSRTILDTQGAEKLLGMGDMLYLRPGGVHLRRMHGAFVSDTEVKKVIRELKKGVKPVYDEKIIEHCEKALEEENQNNAGLGGQIEFDAYYDQAVELVVNKGQASTSMLQRAFRIGYNRAARIIDSMEQEGVIGPMDGAKPREILAEERDYNPQE
ncbi:MAG: DNA translocase FtsK [Bdellovibrionota bacterium]